MFSFAEGGPLARFSLERISEPSPSALEFRRVAESMAYEVALQPGWMLVVDNWRALHARTALKEGEKSNRHFKRRYRW
jgi:alpha-ketoglutarate-dependent taurine dioxygenase